MNPERKLVKIITSYFS